MLASQPWLCSVSVLSLGSKLVTWGNNLFRDTHRAEPPPNGENTSRLGGLEASCALWDLSRGRAPARRVAGWCGSKGFRGQMLRPAQACSGTVFHSPQGQRPLCGKFAGTLPCP